MPTGKPTKLKPCKICGDMFLPDKPSSRICNKNHYIACPICGKNMVWNTTAKPEPCCKECRKESTRRKNKEKYGVDHPMQCKEVQKHHKEAMIQKYGVASPLQSDEIKQRAMQSIRQKFGTDWALSNPEVKKKSEKTMTERYGAKTTLESDILKSKVRSTMIKKYGVPNPSKSPSVRNKVKTTNVLKYGFENPMQDTDICLTAMKTRVENNGSFWTAEIDAKAKATWIERYGVDNPSKSEECMKKAREQCMKKYGVPYGCMVTHDKPNCKISKINLRFAELLHNTGIEYEMEFYLEGKFYDLHILNTNILIEIDPTYTHNIIGNHWNTNGLPEDYHLEKTRIAEGHGYRCIHIFDWDNWDSIINLLRPRTSIGARKFKIYNLTKTATDEFLNKYHIQGTCRGQDIALGLVKDNEIYQVMTFGKSRYDKKHVVELLRMATRTGYQIPGGASKLFHHFYTQYEINSIISYCDLAKFSGQVYEKMGMKLLRTTPPQEIWSKEEKKVTANLLRQRGYDQLFKTNYGKGSDNQMLMLENEWLPICDCGQAVYSLKTQ